MLNSKINFTPKSRKTQFKRWSHWICTSKKLIIYKIIFFISNHACHKNCQHNSGTKKYAIEKDLHYLAIEVQKAYQKKTCPCLFEIITEILKSADLTLTIL